MNVAETNTISIELLKRILDYDPATGIWTNLIQRGKFSAGSVAGGLDSDGYTILIIWGKHYRSARLAWFYMTGEWPAGEVDHEDCVRDNDKWLNLRPATSAQNKRNRRAHSNNKVGVKGVRYRPKCPTAPYAAHIKVGGKPRMIGTFSTIEEASAAYQTAACEAFGEFARG